MAEQLECWTCNAEDLSSSPTLTTSWFCLTENLSFNSLAALVNITNWFTSGQLGFLMWLCLICMLI